MFRGVVHALCLRRIAASLFLTGLRSLATELAAPAIALVRQLSIGSIQLFGQMIISCGSVDKHTDVNDHWSPFTVVTDQSEPFIY
jgi:hypothetical protein